MTNFLSKKKRYREAYVSRPNRTFNYRFVTLFIGILCLIQVVALMSAVAVSLYYFDSGIRPLSITAGIMATVGGILVLIGRHSNSHEAGRKESLLTVTLSWFVVSLIGMLPLYLGEAVPTLADAFFETISGFTTTGASVISDVESVPRSLLFWRSMTQWEGGIGIVVFLVALIPMAGESASLVYNSETTGVTHERFLPRVGNMAKWMILIYVSLTILCVVLLILGPMQLFDATCHAFTCLSTGGFSTKNNSLEHWDSPGVNLVLSAFMFVGATNFTLIYYAVIKRDLRQVWRDSEFRWYIGFILVLIAISVLGVLSQGPAFYSIWKTLLYITTQIISLVTTTGYAVGDYNLWGPLFYIAAMMAMFVAGCTGSTSGGLKIARLEILTKSLSNELLKRTHPNAIRSVKVSGRAISVDFVASTMNFFVAYLLLMVIGAACVALDGHGFLESSVAAISCVSNTGGSLGDIGPMVGFGSLSGTTKVILSLLMVMGRLEIFTILSILHPGFWKN